MKKIPLIIDCDPGIDDAFALVTALLNPALNVLGIHTVSGNIAVENTTRNTQGLLYLLKSDVPIHRGNAVPLVVEPVYAQYAHGANGFAGHEFDDDKLKPVSELSSLEAYYKVLSETEEKVTVVAVGPLTNLAIFLKAYPHLKSKIERISIMGGGIKGGNYTSCGEFNFYVDPEAADIVFNSGIPIIMAGLDVTEKASFSEENLLALKEESKEIGALLYKLSLPGLDRGEKAGKKRLITPNDTVAVLVLTHPELFSGWDMYVRVSCDCGLTRGMSVADVRYSAPPANTYVLLDCDLEKYREVLMESLVREAI